MNGEKPSKLFWKKGEKPVKECTDRSKGICAATSGERQRMRGGGAGRTKKQHTRRRPSLKELCPEDKRRVCQLIEELARVSNEKETAEERLRGERKAFQEILVQLRSEHQEVVKEKQDLESELHASQLNLQSVYMHPHTGPTHYQDQPGNSLESAHPSTGHTSLPRQPPTSQTDDCFSESSHYTQPVQPSRVKAGSQRQRVVSVESILGMPARALPARTMSSSASHHSLEAAPSTAVHVPGCSVVPAMHTYADHIGTSDEYPKSHEFGGNVVTSLPSQFVPGHTSTAFNEGAIPDCLPPYRPESTTPSLLTWTSLPAATPPVTPPRQEPAWCTGEDPTTTTLSHTSNATTLAPWQDTGERTYSIATQTSPPLLSSASAIPTTQTSMTVGVETGPASSRMQDAQVQVCIGSQSNSYPPPTSPQCFNSQAVQHRCSWISSSLHARTGEKEVTKAADMDLHPHPSSVAEFSKSHEGCLRKELLPAKPKFTPQASIAEAIATTEVQTESLVATALLNAQHTVQAIKTLSNVNSSTGHAYSGTASRHSERGEVQASGYVDYGCDNESTDDRPLSPTELAISLNQSTNSFGKLTGGAHSYSSCTNLKAQLQCCAESEDAQVISDLFFI